ncbi:hypothetical protein SAMN02745219_01935 [Desulfofundulus thermosubterraneus DSM 16057]|uniref:Uncharacterized protein n=1 Tax=Desulfofundulus thermosubterraneus DSM 16057 TaxID=1121432 RepID=A0A1M6H828_9FIRM|nr:hypothetical protein SAMN02745219_01935 [Desulfofundulus thermosubterraneus DSM 16057]
MLNIRHIVGAVLLFVKGLIELLGSCKHFYELEKGIHELCQKVSNQIFTWALEQLDARLMNERDRSTWRGWSGFGIKQPSAPLGSFSTKGACSLVSLRGLKRQRR